MSDRFKATDVVEPPLPQKDSNPLSSEADSLMSLFPSDRKDSKVPDCFPKTKIDSESICFSPEGPADSQLPLDEATPSNRLSAGPEDQVSADSRESVFLDAESEQRFALNAAPEEFRPTGTAPREVDHELIQTDPKRVLEQQDGPTVILNGNVVERAALQTTDPGEHKTYLEKGSHVNATGDKTFLNEFRFNGNTTMTGASPDFFETKWNGVEKPSTKDSIERRNDNPSEMKLTPEQEKAEKEFLDAAAKELEKLNVKLKPLHKGEGPYQSIERMVRSGELPHMTQAEIKEHAVRIRNRDFEQMKRGYYKVGERPEFFSQKEMEERTKSLMDQKRNEFRKRLLSEKTAA